MNHALLLGMTQIVRLEQWALHMHPGDGFQAPETLPRFLSGRVYGHPKHEDGKRVSTSSLEHFDPKERTAITQSGRHYQLGEPHPEYVAEMRKRGIEV